MEYLSLPLVLREGHLLRYDLFQSIKNSVGLILSARVGSMTFNPEFGCELWEREYSDLLSANKASIRASLRNAIDKYEKRLSDVSVSFTAGTSDAPHHLGMKVKVTGLYRDGDEDQKFEATYGLG